MPPVSRLLQLINAWRMLRELLTGRATDNEVPSKATAMVMTARVRKAK